jgi:D-alanyl-D-alanine carboxypeptidase
MRRLLVCLLALLCLLGAMPAAEGLTRHRQLPVPPPTVPPPPPPPRAWIVVDDDTGAVIEAGNEHQPMLPASVSKILTALVAVQQLEPDAEVPVSPTAQGMPARNMNMKVGQLWKFDDALHALLMVSANDAAVAIAERVAGSRENFSAVMARTAQRLHMQDNPVVNDPAGLDDEFSQAGGNRISAYDLAIATRAAMAVESIRAVVATQVYRFHGPDNNDHRLLNHNLMLKSYPGGTGVKTGYTKRAGHSLIAAATRDGRSMVSVVLNAADPDRFSAGLLDKGFATPLSAEASLVHLPAVVPNASLDAAAGQAANLVRTPPARAVSSETEAEPADGVDYAREFGWVGLAVIPISILLLRRRVARRRRYLFR